MCRIICSIFADLRLPGVRMLFIFRPRCTRSVFVALYFHNSVSVSLVKVLRFLNSTLKSINEVLVADDFSAVGPFSKLSPVGFLSTNNGLFILFNYATVSHL